MPNRDEHMKVGEATGLMVAAGAVGYGVGAQAGTLPDWLEPAYHPGHRDVCHSVAAGVLVVVAAKKLDDNPKVPEPLKMVANTAVAGQTPAGIPWVTKG